ncbi:protein kinase family protein [Streptacidiphilus fuscans]|uniref:hypothetical protein n=1 Tax=Streptacidiphilus fuscans TaxID=2789292 RepID=UPI002E2D6DB4|nr:hypothetical protein [Streptacidiphilus fuscans]
MRPAHPLPELWLRGVAANPAAPTDVLLRLLDPAARDVWPVLCEQRALPADFVEAALVHHDRAVRRAVARNRHVPVAQRGRLVHDPDSLVRCALAAGPRPQLGDVEPLPDDVLVTFLTALNDDPNRLVTAQEIRDDLQFSGQIPQAFLRRLPEHQAPELRIHATRYWLWLTPEQREALLTDPDPEVRQAAHGNSRVLDPDAMAADLGEPNSHHRSLLLTSYAVAPAVAERCLAEGRDLWALAHNPYTPAQAVSRLAHSPDPKVRERVAARADLSSELLAELAGDPDSTVRSRAHLQGLPRTWPQRNAIDRIIGRSAERLGYLGEAIVEPDTSWFEACARSGHPLLRRVAATFHRLPEDHVARLSEDEDEGVRILLACNHPLAPPHLVLNAFLAAPPQRAYLRTLPRLPRTGLAHLLGHADPEVRALAAADQTLPEPPLALLADGDERVRREAAANPLLPHDLLEDLLDRAETAEGAAANPAQPAPRLHELLDRSGLP